MRGITGRIFGYYTGCHYTVLFMLGGLSDVVR